MAAVCWMVVALAFFLSAGTGVDAVDQNQLQTIVADMLGRYRIGGQFSLAVNIPLNNTQDLQTALGQVFDADPGANVSRTVSGGRVYTGTWVVAAGADKINNRHAELRVLDSFRSLLNKPERKLLLFYSYLSPCDQKCTNERHRDTIISRINIIQNWHDYAFVFSKIFKPKGSNPISEENLKASLERLGKSKNTGGSEIGLANIFRCDRKYNVMTCNSCSTRGQVTRQCIADTSRPGPSGVFIGGPRRGSGQGGAQSQNQRQGLSTSLGQRHRLSTSLGQTQGQGQGLSTSLGQTQGLSTSLGQRHGLSTSLGQRHGLSTSLGQRQGQGLSTSLGQTRGLSTSLGQRHRLSTSLGQRHRLSTSLGQRHRLSTSLGQRQGRGSGGTSGQGSAAPPGDGKEEACRSRVTILGSAGHAIRRRKEQCGRPRPRRESRDIERKVERNSKGRRS
ncbi:uncharacterized protein LOC115357819 [Myripristis murdjan]|uniref:uncharacterized protein LOC115357819 n=1 Tax=Myripristis murdjan TaxID=586833 RepID=UPI0011761570|nr:uncharacterized protein LOC115357819 [Myripristis murdjan]